MKKKIFIPFIIVTAALLAGCERDYDRVFSDSPDARAQADVNKQTQLLTTAPYGWKAVLETGSGVSFFYYFSFTADSVVMLSDFNEETATKPKVSLWTVKSLQTTTLSFTTYSYIHLPADPTGEVSGGNDGVGLESDSEFAFGKTSGDSLLLDGLQHGARISFLQATQAERDLAMKGRIAEIRNYTLAAKAQKLTVDNRLITVAFNGVAKTVTTQYISDDGKRVVNNKVSYAVGMNGLVLSKPLQAASITINALTWDADNKRLYAETAGGNKFFDALTDTYLFKPSIPFASALGVDFVTMRVPDDVDINPLPGQSEAFTTAWKTADQAMQTGQFHLALSEMYFTFDVAAKKMTLQVFVTRSGSVYLCQYNYTYTSSAAGLRFTYVNANGNGNALRATMGPILLPLSSDTFAGEFIGGGSDPLGGFFSQESPAFSFAGFLEQE